MKTRQHNDLEHGQAREPKRRCKHCPFATKQYATLEECGNCEFHEKGCEELTEYQRAIMLAST